MDDLHLHEPAVGLEDPEALDGLVARLARRRYHHEYDDRAAALVAARRHVEGVGDRGRLIEVRAGARLEQPVGEVWMVTDHEERAVVDVVLREDAPAPDVRRLLTDLARGKGAVRLTVTVSPGDTPAEALVRGGGLELMATQMLLGLDTGRPPTGPGSSVTLEAMDEPGFARWLADKVERYVVERAAAGETPERARRISTRQHADLLPQGLHTEHHHVFVAVADGQRVGTVWIGTERPMAYVYDLEIDHAHRRRGHGAATMRAAADWSGGRGAHALGLNVFGPNRAARSLYDALGYRVTEEFWGLAL